MKISTLFKVTQNADVSVKVGEDSTFRVWWTPSSTLLTYFSQLQRPSHNSPLISPHLPVFRLNLTKQMLIQYNSKHCLSLGINMHFYLPV